MPYKPQPRLPAAVLGQVPVELAVPAAQATRARQVQRTCVVEWNSFNDCNRVVVAVEAVPPVEEDSVAALAAPEDPVEEPPVAVVAVAAAGAVAAVAVVADAKSSPLLPRVQTSKKLGETVSKTAKN